MYEIVRYTPELKAQWDSFVRKSRNGTFLFLRDYMDYHRQRFTDFSLLIFHKQSLVALLPLNKEADGSVASHSGLTYGGLITDKKGRAEKVMKLFECLNTWLRDAGITRVVYRPVPWIYHEMPAEEDLYALFNVCNARLTAREISSTIAQENKLAFSQSRKDCLRKADKAGVKVTATNDLAAFWDILSSNLQQRYAVTPVHSLAEIMALASLFPHEIRLYAAYLDNEMVAGTVVYVMPRVVHVQYISASAKGKAVGALDLLFRYLIDEVFVDKPYFDFGKSTEDRGRRLNEQLIFQKEGFGGRGVCYDTYEWTP
ncbi:MAG: GNAT family N-acetyltransferase [Prevotella sp.]